MYETFYVGASDNCQIAESFSIKITSTGFMLGNIKSIMSKVNPNKTEETWACEILFVSNYVDILSKNFKCVSDKYLTHY